MTKIEAINAIENSLTDLSVSWKGEKFVGLEAIGIVSRFVGPKWEALENNFESDRITPEEYALTAKEYIASYKHFRFSNKADRGLSSLKKKQSGGHNG